MHNRPQSVNRCLFPAQYDGGAVSKDTLDPSVVDGRPVVGVDPDADMLLEPCSQQNTDSMSSRPRELSFVVGSPMAGQPAVSPDMPDTDYQPATHTISVKRFLERLKSVKADSSYPYSQLYLLKHQPGCEKVEDNEEITDLDKCARDVKNSTTQVFSAYKVLYSQRIKTLHAGLWANVPPQLKELIARFGFYASEETVNRELSVCCFIDGCRIMQINLEDFKLEMLWAAHSDNCKLIRQLRKTVEPYKEFGEIIAFNYMRHSASKDSGLNLCFDEALLSPLRRRAGSSGSIDSFQSYGDDSSYPHTPNQDQEPVVEAMELEECLNGQEAECVDTNNNGSEVDEKFSDFECVICRDATAVIVALPCRHVVWCKKMDCLNEFSKRNNGVAGAKCPICKKVMSDSLVPIFAGFPRQS